MKYSFNDNINIIYHQLIIFEEKETQWNSRNFSNLSFIHTILQFIYLWSLTKLFYQIENGKHE